MQAKPVKTVKTAMIKHVTTRTLNPGFVIEAALQMLSVDESALPTDEKVPHMECMILTLHRMTLHVVAIVVRLIEGIEMISVDVHHLGIDQQAREW